MAYARRDENSDVYVYGADGLWECCPCNTAYYHQDTRLFSVLSDLLFHLENHTLAGDKVPDHTLEHIKRELAHKEKEN